MLHQADFPFGRARCYSTLVWGTFSWHPHQASHSLEQKTTEDCKEYLFHQGMINWYKWLKQWEIMEWIWKGASQEKLCLFQAYFNELFITGQEKLLCVFLFLKLFCKIIMASWSEEEEVEGSGSCEGVRGGGVDFWRWGGGGGGGGGGRRCSLRNWSSPFSAEIFQSCGSFQAAALWSRPDEKKTKQIKEQRTTIWQNTVSMFKQGDKRASDVAPSVDTPHRGDLTEMKRRPRRFIMNPLVLWEKSKRATFKHGG